MSMSMGAALKAERALQLATSGNGRRNALRVPGHRSAARRSTSSTALMGVHGAVRDGGADLATIARRHRISIEIARLFVDGALEYATGALVN